MPDAQRRVLIAVRLKPAALDRVDERARRAGVKRSEMIRRMLAYAASRMPQTFESEEGNRSE